MEEKILKISCIVLGMLAAGVIVIGLISPDIQGAAAGMYDSYESTSIESLIESADLEHDMEIPIPSYINSKDIKTQNNYLTSELEIFIPGIHMNYFTDFPAEAKRIDVKDVRFVREKGKEKVVFTFNGIVEPVVTTGEKSLFIDFKKPNEVFEKIVVLDAGHGGEDTGVVLSGINEKDINLAIMLELMSALSMEEKNIGVFCTRLDDTFCSLDERIDITNNVEADLFVSIHENSTSSGRMSGISGAEVLYLTTDTSDRSRQAAKQLLDSIVSYVKIDDRGISAGDDQRILRDVNCPAVIVEPGFMSNREELKKLTTKEYQSSYGKAMAKAIVEILYENSYSDGK